MNELKQSIRECFEETALLHTGRAAVCCAGGGLTYGELNAAADRIAAAMCGAGTDDRSRVALLFHQGAAGIAALLGAVKSGHAHVMLDIADPAARLQFILNDCMPFAIVTDDAHVELAHRLSPGGCKVINTDRLGESPSQGVPRLATTQIAPPYLVYTSGSTGQPKGVFQSLGNLLHFVRSYTGIIGVTHQDRLSLLFSLNFSAANLDIFTALLKGATLCCYDVRIQGTAGLADWLDREAVTSLHVSPSLFRHVMRHIAPGRRFETLRTVDLGGEAVHPSDVELFNQHCSANCALINRLAATEASVVAYHRIDPRRSYSGQDLPVGRPAEGIEICIVREDGTAADAGEVGEILVRSPYLSLGYCQQPELTAKTFFEGSDGRTYRSSDLGRMGPDQELYFLGRKGSRVKIRGHSIDLFEVESALLESEWVQEAVVVAGRRPDAGAAEQLVAYVVPAIGSERNADPLRRDLLRRLPSYMLPSSFVFLESIPLGASGKADRAALADRQSPWQEEAGPFVPPADPLEIEIAEVYQRVLRRPTVGRNSDFFALGGDSLQAAELHIRLEHLIGRKIELRHILRDSTVAGVATALRRLQIQHGRCGSQQGLLTPLRATGSHPILFLVHGRLGQAFVSPHFLSLLGEEQPVYAFQARGLDGRQRPYESIVDMASAYIGAMRDVQPRGPYFLGGLCAGCTVAIEMAVQLRRAGEGLMPLLLIDPSMIAPRVRSVEWHLRRRASLLSLHVPYLWRRLVGTTDSTIRRLLMRTREGRIALNAEDPILLKSAVRVATTLELALTRHKSFRYDGPACVLVSEQRSASAQKSPAGSWRDYLTGDVHVFEAGAQHSDIFAVENEAFAGSLRRCLDAISGGDELSSSTPRDGHPSCR